MYTRTFWIDSIIIFFFKKSFFRVFKRSNILFKKHYFQKGSAFIFYGQKKFFLGAALAIMKAAAALKRK
jgi:hypothetical protein